MNEPSHQTHFRQREEAAAQSNQQHATAGTPLQFETAEELLRHDAATVVVPDTVAGRLAESAANEPPAPWWRRLLGTE